MQAMRRQRASIDDLHCRARGSRMTDELHGTQGSPRPRRPNPDPSGVREARQDLRRVAQTVGWGDGAIDKALIAAYYSLLVASRMFRPRQALGAGIHPEFWLGDLSVRTPIGRFPCRARRRTLRS